VAQRRVPRASILRAAQQHLGITLNDVWLGYVSVGGDAPLRVVRDWLTGVTEPDDHDHDLMAQAFNDRFVDRGLDHPVAYAETLTP
jgi:hypothetical protein